MKVTKLNSIGAAHLLIPLLIVVGVGIVGSYVAVKSMSHADSALVPCRNTGKKTSDSRFTKHNCQWYGTTPVQSSVDGKKIGSFNAGINWVACQWPGKRVKVGSSYNNIWGYTKANNGKWGWVNAVYANGGSNNHGFQGVPNCPNPYNINNGMPFPPR